MAQYAHSAGAGLEEQSGLAVCRRFFEGCRSLVLALQNCRCVSRSVEACPGVVLNWCGLCLVWSRSGVALVCKVRCCSGVDLVWCGVGLAWSWSGMVLVCCGLRLVWCWCGVVFASNGRGVGWSKHFIPNRNLRRPQQLFPTLCDLTNKFALTTHRHAERGRG